ncbi:MAG: hypothetical protein KTR24_14490 [Saprospiraceae bacterium]|nr:hypothetical protein [Saprospiraceae bacterium]
MKKVFGVHRKVVWICYVVLLIVSIPLAFLLYDLFAKVWEDSLSVERLIGEFDYTIWRDALNQEQETWKSLWKMLAVLFPIGLMLMSLSSAGVYYCLDKKSVRVGDFLKGIRTLGWRYLAIALVMICLLALWSLAIWTYYLSHLFEFLEFWKDDRYIVWLGAGLLAIWGVGAYVLFMIGNVAKVEQLQCRGNVLRSFFTGWRNKWNACIRLAPSILLIISIGIAITVLYLGLSSTFKPSAVLVLLLFQQLVTWGKVGLRISAYETVRSFVVGTS